MNTIVFIMIFCLTFFFYTHIHFHKKVSDDAEVYDIVNPTKEQLDEVCDLRQPVKITQCSGLNFDHKTIVEKFGNFEVNVRIANSIIDDSDDTYKAVKLQEVINRTQSTDEKILTENNKNFIRETSLDKMYKSNDILIPHLLSFTEYDYIIASNKSTTVLKYDLFYRNFFQVVEGTVKVKLCSPNNRKDLYEIKDYENFEFRSPVDVWNVQDEYVDVCDKINWLEIPCSKSDIVYIPAYWWYSFEFDNGAVLAKYSYSSIMSTISIADHTMKYFLQGQNIKRIIHPII